MSRVVAMSDTSEIPGGGAEGEARESGLCLELIESWLGYAVHDLHLAPGEDVVVPDDAPLEAAAARRFRDVLGQFASGVTVVTAMSGDEPVGMTCQSFSSVSLDPPLVMFVPSKTSRAWPLIQRAGHFCVNVLGAEQADLSNAMASRGTDKFTDVAWTPAPRTGSPVLSGTLAHVDCTIHAVHEAGDHYVVIGRALDLRLGDQDRDPLLFFRGQYRTTAPD